MLKQIAAEIQDHAEIKLGVYVVIEDGRAIRQNRNRQSDDDYYDKQTEAILCQRAQERNQKRRQRVILQHAIDQDFERPRRQQTNEASHDNEQY